MRRCIIRCAVLNALGIADLFDDVFSIEHTDYRPKPDSYGFLKLCRKNRVRAARCIMVEDTLENLRTAKKLGMTTVWVARAARHSRLRRFQHQESAAAAAPARGRLN